MSGTIHRMPQKPQLEQLKRVAAYARVSSGKDAMLHSLSSQVSYYSKLIQGHEGWLFIGVYTDVDTPYGLNPKIPSTADSFGIRWLFLFRTAVVCRSTL